MLGPALRLVLALVLAGVAAACSSDSSAPPSSEAGASGPDGGAVPRDDGAVVPPFGSGGAPPAAEAGAGGGTDAAEPARATNTDFAHAKVITPSAQPILQDVLSATQQSFFAFEGKAGTFYRLSTDVGVFAPDNVLSLYGPDRQLFAENDDGPRWPGERVDVRLVVRLPEDGTYHVKVVSPTLNPAIFEGAFPLIYYHLTVEELRPGMPGISFDGEEVAFVRHEQTGYAVTTVLGVFDAGAGDAGGVQNVHRLNGDAGRALIGRVHPSGIHGNGSTALSGLAHVQDSGGSVLAAIDRSHGQSAIHPPVEGESYTLTMTPAAGMGANAFYAVDLVLLPENPKETASTTNGALASAEAITMDGTTYRQGFILAYLSESDVDYFRFDAAEGESVSVVCESESAGSGVQHLHAEVRNASDAVVASADETATENLYVEPAKIATAGTHYLRLSSDTPASTSVAPWVRCLVFVEP